MRGRAGRQSDSRLGPTESETVIGIIILMNKKAKKRAREAIKKDIAERGTGSKEQGSSSPLRSYRRAAASPRGRIRSGVEALPRPQTGFRVSGPRLSPPAGTRPSKDR